MVRTLTLWNEMMAGLGETTTLNVEQLAAKTQGIDVSLSRGSALTSGVNQSQLSQFSVRDDARDLLEKYS